MPLIVQEAAQPRCPRDFALSAAPNQQLTEIEQRCRDQVNGYVTYLATINPNPDGQRDQELIELRNQYLGLLHDRADDVIANTLTAEELLYTRYVYQGQFEIKFQRIHDAIFVVGFERTRDDLLRVNFDITKGKTTPEQAALVRSIKETEVVFDVVLKRPRLGFASTWRSVQWNVRRDYHVRELVNIGRIGLMEGNIELSEDNLKSLKDGFLVQQAEAVKNRYVRRLGIWALLWILVNAIGYVLVCRYLAPAARAALIDGGYSFLADIAWRFRNFFLLAIGTALGAWLAFLIQRPKLTFSDLVQLDENLLPARHAGDFHNRARDRCRTLCSGPAWH